MPIQQDGLQLGAKTFRKHQDLLTEIAHQATAAEAMPSHARLGVLDEIPQPLERRDIFRQKPQIELLAK